MKIFVTVKCNARKEIVERIDEDHFKISVKESPLKGRANDAVKKLLAKHIDILPDHLKIVSGKSSSKKVIKTISR